MIYPSLSSLLDRMDSRYTLVVATSKRARQITEGAEKLSRCDSEKPVTIALNEIFEDKITYLKPKSGNK